MHVQIVYTDSGRGLTKDSTLLRLVLESLGHQVTVCIGKPASERRLQFTTKWHKALNRFLSPGLRRLVLQLQRRLLITYNGKSRNDLVIHLQSVQPGHLYNNASHWLIPNQEWFAKEQLHYLQELDTIVCKTKTARELFSQYHDNTVLTGFSSPLIPAVHSAPKKDFQKVLHVAGNSLFKGTDTLLKVWQKHPEWPTLTVVSNHNTGPLQAPNITVLSNVADGKLRKLWKQAGIAVQPSEVEGYGQVLAEAQACRCVVITTDAPPMNEVITNSTGVLVPYSSTQAFRLGTRYFVDPEALEAAIHKVVSQQPDKLEKLGQNAASHTRNNHQAFITRISGLLSDQERTLPRVN